MRLLHLLNREIFLTYKVDIDEEMLFLNLASITQMIMHLTCILKVLGSNRVSPFAGLDWWTRLQTN